MKGDERVLVIGASGAVGMAAVQIAKHFGADVTGVCSSANLDLVQAIGADRTVDYTKTDLASLGDTYDIIFDTTGAATFQRHGSLLNEGGRLLLIQPSFAQSLGFGRPPRNSSKKVIAQAPPPSIADMSLLAEMAQAGTLKPFIDRRYPLADAATAHAYVDTGRKRGNVVLTVD